MQKRFKKVLFIFRRDLRLEDNTGLNFALQHSQEVMLAFIFTPQQIQNNSYRSDHCVQFMLESLESLEKSIAAKQGRLYLFFGDEKYVIEECLQKLKLEAVVVNRDYTPYSKQRDEKIKAVCDANQREFYAFDDLLLQSPEKSLKKDGSPYTIFTPFFQNVAKLPVAAVSNCVDGQFYAAKVPFAKDSSLYQKILPKRLEHTKGGREASLQILSSLSKFKYYESLRDYPAKDETTHLSAYLKFNTCSIREVYAAIIKKLGKESSLIRSLYWRDFFTCVAYYYPHIFGQAFHKKYNQLPWDNNEYFFKRWCEGTTGFPLVDAGMRQMNATGFMHNRTRLITASFLVKDLHIDWRWGEKYFAQKLIDYDPAINNGNWQWVASTGCARQPYFRIFNPWSQAAKFDADCQYIKMWVKELEALPSATILKWYKACHTTHLSYPKPVVEHDVAAQKALASFRSLNVSSRG